MKVVQCVVVAFLLPGAAWAGGPIEAVPEAAVEVAAPAAIMQDWSGLYGGATAGSVVNGTGTYVYSGVDGDFYDFSGSGAGIFVGYNMQQNALVYGAELAAQFVDFGNGEGSSGGKFETMIDVKLRAGMAVGRAMPYAFIGYSSGDWNNNDSLTNPRATGANYGVGVDMMVATSWFAGLEYIQRDLSTDFNENDNGFGSDFGTVQLRVGYTF